MMANEMVIAIAGHHILQLDRRFWFSGMVVFCRWLVARHDPGCRANRSVFRMSLDGSSHGFGDSLIAGQYSFAEMRKWADSKKQKIAEM